MRKLQKKKFDLLASIGLIFLIINIGIPTLRNGQIIFNALTPYLIYIVLVIALRRYFYTDK